MIRWWTGSFRTPPSNFRPMEIAGVSTHHYSYYSSSSSPWRNTSTPKSVRLFPKIPTISISTPAPPFRRSPTTGGGCCGGGGGGLATKNPQDEEEEEYNSAAKAFSSMVFMIKELQTFTLLQREEAVGVNTLVLPRVHGDMQSSFCWLFHKIFSSSPTLMLSVMLLLVNFTVHSITTRPAAAAWRRTVEEASKMKSLTHHSSLMNKDTLLRLVSPVTVEIPPEDVAYSDVDEFYRAAVEAEPENALFLNNYAQFLYQVAHDHDRAERFFRRAAAVDPPDAEALSRYAGFLWRARKDVDAAEEMFLQAIAADPRNSSHAATYAHFLWNTGGEDTCFPLTTKTQILNFPQRRRRRRRSSSAMETTTAVAE